MSNTRKLQAIVFVSVRRRPNDFLREISAPVRQRRNELGQISEMSGSAGINFRDVR